MKRFVTITMLCAGCLLTASAQTFTQRLQEKGRVGEGTVTVTHAKAIDDLVNKSSVPQASQPQKKEEPTKPKKPETKPLTQLSDTTAQRTESGRKVMTNGYRVDGFRVQAFAGGNQRKDRQKAEQVGNTIKSLFPGTPVYVHFYSPRWVCRVGNYRTYEEADEMLRNILNLGISGASIVKGKIIVQN